VALDTPGVIDFFEILASPTLYYNFVKSNRKQNHQSFNLLLAVNHFLLPLLFFTVFYLLFSSEKLNNLA